MKEPDIRLPRIMLEFRRVFMPLKRWTKWYQDTCRYHRPASKPKKFTWPPMLTDETGPAEWAWNVQKDETPEVNTFIPTSKPQGENVEKPIISKVVLLITKNTKRGTMSVRQVARNGEIVASTEKYQNAYHARKVAQRLAAQLGVKFEEKFCQRRIDMVKVKVRKK